MEKNTIFLYAIAAAGCFALANAFQFLLKREKTAQAAGIISSVKMPNAD